MMKKEDFKKIKNNRGKIFENKNKNKPKDPDGFGYIKIDDTVHQLSVYYVDGGMSIYVRKFDERYLED